MSKCVLQRVLRAISDTKGPLRKEQCLWIDERGGTALICVAIVPNAIYKEELEKATKAKKWQCIYYFGVDAPNAIYKEEFEKATKAKDVALH